MTDLQALRDKKELEKLERLIRRAKDNGATPGDLEYGRMLTKARELRLKLGGHKILAVRTK